MAQSLALAFDVLARDKGASKTFEKVGGAAEHAGKLGKIAGAALAAGMLAVSVAAVKFAKSSVGAFEDTAAEAKGLRRVMGGTIEDASRLNFAAQQTGVGTGTLATALKTLEVHLTSTGKAQKNTVLGYKYVIEQVPKLVKGHIQYRDALKKVAILGPPAKKAGFDLGLAYKDAHDKILPMSVLLPKIADRFKSMPDGAEKTALAVKFFGRQGIALLPFLNKGAEGIAELNKESDKLGHTLSGPDLDAIKANAEAHKKFHAAIEGLQIQVGRLLLPILAKFATFAAGVLVPIIVNLTNLVNTKLAPALHSFISGLSGKTDGSLFSKLGVDVDKLETKISTAFGKAKVIVGEFFDGFQGKKITGGHGHQTEIAGGDSAAASAAASVGVKARSLFDELRAAITDKLIPAVRELVTNIGSLALTMAKNLFPILRDVVGKLFDARAVVLPLAAAFLAINAAITVTTGVIDAVTGVTDTYKKAMEGLTAVKVFFTATTDAETGAVTLSSFAQKKATIAKYAGAVASGVAAAATAVLTGSVVALDAALAILTSPITLVIAAVALLVIGIIEAWKHSETFRKIVISAFQAVGTAVLQYVRISLSVLDVFARASDALFGTHFHKHVQGAIDGIDRLQSKLDHLGDKTITIKVNSGQALSDLLTVDRATRSGATSSLTPGRNARGTASWRGGLTWVGEKGPELADIPRGARIFTHEKSMAMAGGGAGLHVHGDIIAQAAPDERAAESIPRALSNLAFRAGLGTA